MRPKVALINDTGLFESHFGCQLVSQTYREQFARLGLDLALSLPRDFDLNQVSAELDKMDLLVVNGEGSIHHGRCHHLIALASRFPAVLVNCVYQQNPPDWDLGGFLYVSARESLSAAEIERQGCACDVVPDIMYASMFLHSFHKPEPKRQIGITDNVRKEKWKVGPFCLKKKKGFPPNRSMAADYLRELCFYERLCIGRFHAVVAASVLEIPFSSWDSNTWKTKGLMGDMGVSRLHFSTCNEARKHVPVRFDPQIKDFASEARRRVIEMFDTIGMIASSQVDKRS